MKYSANYWNLNVVYSNRKHISLLYACVIVYILPLSIISTLFYYDFDLTYKYAFACEYFLLLSNILNYLITASEIYENMLKFDDSHFNFLLKVRRSYEQ